MAKLRVSSKAVAGLPHRVLNLLPSKDTESDWSVATAVAMGALRAAKLPEAVDLREAWWKAGNQGTTGSCVGWATADGVMRYLLVKAGRLVETALLSPRYVWMASKETDGFIERPESFIEAAGTSLKAAADICRKYGVVLDSELPFEIRTTMSEARPSCSTPAPRPARRQATSMSERIRRPGNRPWLQAARSLPASMSM